MPRGTPTIGDIRLVRRLHWWPLPHWETVMERYHDPEWERDPIDAPWHWENPRWHRVRIVDHG